MEGRKHEETDVSIRPIVIFGGGLFVSVVAVLVAMAWLAGYFRANQPKAAVPPPALAQAPQVAPEPRLQVSAPRDLEKMREAEHNTLTTYGWVDAKAGVIRIPIERAMELVAERDGKK